MAGMQVILGCLRSQADGRSAAQPQLVLQVDSNVLSTAIKAYQDTVRKCSANSEQRLKVGVLEPSDVEKDFRRISRLGRAEQSFRAIGSGLVCLLLL
jgi:hypothetical protein